MKKIIIVDPSFTSCSPSMKNLLKVLESLDYENIEIEAWTRTIENKAECISKVVFIKTPYLMQKCGVIKHLLEKYWFCLYCSIKVIRLRLFSNDTTRVVSVGSATFFANAYYLHTCNIDWLVKCLKIKVWNFEWLLNVLNAVVMAIWTWLMLFQPFRKEFYVVSDGIADNVRKFGVNCGVIKVLPNPVLLKEYDRKKLDEMRQVVRAQYRVKKDQYLYGSLATGKLLRKGVWKNFEVVYQLRRKGHKNVKFMFVGGGARLVNRCEVKLDKLYPDWRDWIILTGMADEVEPYYAAMDAFMFLSYSDGFAMSCIEAMSIGMPVYVTPFIGHSMFMKDGVNGRVLPWEIEGIVNVMNQELSNGLHNSYKPDMSLVWNFDDYTEGVIEMIDGNSSI